MSPNLKPIILVATAAVLGAFPMLVAIPAPLAFKPKLVTDIIPDLLSVIFVIAALSERATAVINSIWFGAERETKQETVRVKGKEFVTTVAINKLAVDAQAKLAIEAVRSGQMQPSATTMETVIARPAQDVRVITAELAEANQKLVAVDGKVDRARLLLSFVVGLVISFVGVRLLAPLFQNENGAWFSLVDVVLTAGVLAGGTTAFSAISELIGTFVNASRKRALEGGNP